MNRSDWDVYDSMLGPVVGGQKYDWDVDKVGKDAEAWTVLLDGLSIWYSMPVRPTAGSGPSSKVPHVSY